MSYRVVVLARASRDIDSIVGWLVKRSPLGAQRWMAALESAKARLRDDPLSFPLIFERIRVSFEIRDVLFKTPRGKRYRAVFTVVANEVRILRIRRPAQRPLLGRNLPKQK